MEKFMENEHNWFMLGNIRGKSTSFNGTSTKVLIYSRLIYNFFFFLDTQSVVQYR